MRKILFTACIVVAPLLAAADGTSSPAPDIQLRADILAMKESARGPFRRIRWFCEDGSVLAPEPFACVEHGGGHQRGQWTDTTVRIRAAGYPIANVLASLGPEHFVGTALKERHLRALLLEQFLIMADDGWILRRARYYRGAFQIEDEIAGAQRILEGLTKSPQWLNTQYPLIVEATRLLPTEKQSVSAAAVRGLATAINEQDESFLSLRTKIHNRPDASDAAAVRLYAIDSGTEALADTYAQLANDIDALYTMSDPVPQLQEAASRGLAPQILLDAIARLANTTDERATIAILAGLMASVRDNLGTIEEPNQRVDAVRLILELEAQIFAKSQNVLDSLTNGTAASRAQYIGLLTNYATALYGLGLLTSFEREQIAARLASLAGGQANLANYRDALASLDRVPGWAGRRLALYFEEIIADFEHIEPLASEFIPDRLRGSPLLQYSLILRVLATDAALASGTKSELFGRPTVTGLRRLNPGLGRGVLRTLSDLEALRGDTGDSIVIVPQTIAELPPVAGIITAQEGNALSHVQLLARNLGIPNVVASTELMPSLLTRTGSRVELAATAGGIVQLRDAPAQARQESGIPARLMLNVNVDKLDLDTRRLIPTSELSPADSGVRVGPKAAQLGELTRQFPGNVSPGLAIPFGVFRSLLDQPRTDGGESTFAWMKARFQQLTNVEDAALRNLQTGAFLEELRSWIETTQLDPQVEKQIRSQIESHLGPDGSFGVFVRSDTNVEDLPGFTGAGLNLTVPNVVGTDNIIAAIRRVWASPFTERAYGWRQALMREPEHVYAAVLLHSSVNADKSGVLITADVDTGSREYITVVVNEGVGGGVEGQSAETLRVALAGGDVMLLNPASAPGKRVLLDAGGSALVPSSGSERLLTSGELDSLRAFTRRVSRWFTDVPEDKRQDVIADVEFGFKDGQLVLFQIRPFVQSKRALSDPYLIGLDGDLARTAGMPIDMGAAPRTEVSR